MNKKIIAAAGAAAIVSTAAFADTNKEIAIGEMASLFVSFDAEQAKATMAEDLIQHNPTIPTGRDVLINFIPALKESGISAISHRFIVDGDLVVVHNEYKNAKLFGGDHLAAFDVFRIEDGKVAEHWDNILAVQPPNPSGRTQFDGETTVTDLDKTEANKTTVKNFVTDVLMNGEVDKLTTYINPDKYLQHNPAVADGLDGLGAALKYFADNGLVMEYDTLHKVIGEGNFVLTMSEGKFGENVHSAFYDLFRLENDQIVEHWDVVAEIPAESANENGKF